MFNYKNLIQDRQNKLLSYIVDEFFLASYYLEIIYKLLILLVYKRVSLKILIMRMQIWFYIVNFFWVTMNIFELP